MGNDYKKLTKGRLYGLGLGPGDPELLTVKTSKILQRVDIIFTPRSEHKADSPATNIVKQYVPDKKIEEIIFPMTKNKKQLHDFWQQATAAIYKEISAEKEVAFATLGDPYIFSPYGYLIEHMRELDQGVEIITVPGISAVNAASALGNIPLALAEDRLTVIPLPHNLEHLKTILALFNTVVIMKIGSALPRLIEFLKKEGLENNFFLAQRIGFPKQFITRDISDLNDKTHGHLSIVIVKTKGTNGYE